MIRRSTGALAVLAFVAAAVTVTFVDAGMRRAEALDGLALRARMVGTLGLTDLCLFTEARYTRHPSQADRHTAFQDHPVSFDHVPSGSLVQPPALVWRP